MTEGNLRLKDKVAIITGGAQGIGRAYALGMTDEGASLVIADINLEAAQQTAKEIQETTTDDVSTNDAKKRRLGPICDRSRPSSGHRFQPSSFCFACDDTHNVPPPQLWPRYDYTPLFHY